MQQQTTEELCNLLVQSVEAKDEKTILRVLEQEDEAIVKEIINRVPVHHVRKLIIELRNILSNKLTVNHLQWLQLILASKFTVISSMADGRSILLPLISLLEDRSSPAYYVKMQALKGKIDLLKQLKESRRSETAETVVRVPIERDQPNHIEVEMESETESEEEFDDEEEEDEDIDDDEGVDSDGIGDTIGQEAAKGLTDEEQEDEEDDEEEEEDENNDQSDEDL